MHTFRSALIFVTAFSAVECRAAESSGKALIGEMNCTACHAASALQQAWITPRGAPKQADLGERVNPEWTRKHLVAPTGSMPDLLHGDEAKADALTHYLYSVSASKWKAMAPDKGAVARGESLFHRVGCVACHAPQNGAAAPTDSIPLPDMAGKWTLRGLKRFLLDPLAVRPSGRMPAMGLADAEAQDLAHYLLRTTKIFSPLEVSVYRERLNRLSDLDEATVQRTVRVNDFSLAVPDVRDRLQLRFSGWLRIDVAGDYGFHIAATNGASRIALDDHWIEDEHCWERDRTNANGTLHLDAGWHALKLDFVQRGGKPPTLSLEWDGPDVKRGTIPAERLRAEREVAPASANDFVVDASKAAQGRALFAELNCAACHEGKAPTKPLQTLASLDLARGCLAESPPPGAPNYHLGKDQRVAISAALGSFDHPPSPKERATLTMSAFRCFACHKRDGIGGVTADRDTFFTSNVDDLGDEGRLPPSLDGVGDRLRPEWLAKVLEQGASVRPYLNTRMPQFGAPNVGHLAPLFVSLDRQARPIVEVKDNADTLREAGRKLVGTDGLSCIACHRFARQPAHALHVMDLTTTTERLNEDWFRAFLPDPNRFHLGTRMPSFWPGGRSVIPTVLDGDTNRQHAALWAYLKDGANAKFPEGLSRKNMELVVGGEAVVYRGKLWEAGFRAIAVGYPGQMNAAFDAEEIRLALLWRGRFLDASPHWSVQGMGSIHPLDRDPVVFPHGAPFAVLTDATAPWPTATSKDSGMKFKGYQLDAMKRPTMLYAFKDVAIDDLITNSEVNGKPALHRLIKFSGPKLDGLHLRLAVGKLVSAGENTWRLNDAITILAAGAVARGNELLVPVEKVQLEVDYVW